MAILKGTILGSIKSTAYNIPCIIKSICLWNRTGGATVNVGIVDENGVETYFKASTLTSGASDVTGTDIKVKAGWQIIIVASASIDYYLTIE